MPKFKIDLEGSNPYGELTLGHSITMQNLKRFRPIGKDLEGVLVLTVFGAKLKKLKSDRSKFLDSQRGPLGRPCVKNSAFWDENSRRR